LHFPLKRGGVVTLPRMRGRVKLVAAGFSS
jgi:hypothetical protein